MDPLLVRAARREPVERTPIWFMRQAGRSLPEGLAYVDSWVAADFSRCFQLMRCDDLPLIQAWILEWRGAGVTFEIVPVVTSAETRATVEPHLDRR